MHGSLPRALALASLLAFAGCGAFTAGAEPADIRSAAWSADAEARDAAYPSSTAPVEPADTIEYAPGALLDVWMYDGESDLPAATSERSMGSAVVENDFFRYNAINSVPDLRDFWGQHLILKWTGFIEIRQRGQHVFISNVAKEDGWGALRVQTLVRLDGESLFEKRIREFGGNEFSEVGSRSVLLEPGFHRLEVWLAVDNNLVLPQSTQLGTYITMREPGGRTGERLSSARVFHRVR